MNLHAGENANWKALICADVRMTHRTRKAGSAHTGVSDWLSAAYWQI